MPLTEKTLELNITHELLMLGHGISSVFWANSPRAGLPPPSPAVPIYAKGLSLQEEALRGWDVSIELPVLGSTPSRIFFLQFKLGSSRTYSTYPGSCFGTGKPNTAHVLFGINNNTLKNQHGRLKKTARGLGHPYAAMYAFPRITSQTQLSAHAGHLLSMTSFISAPVLDRYATPSIRDGIDRKVAISELNPNIREVRSNPTIIEERDEGAQLIAEILTVRLQREMSAWQKKYAYEIIDDPRLIAQSDARGRQIVFSILALSAYFLGNQHLDLASLTRSIDTANFGEIIDNGGHISKIIDSARPLLVALINGSWRENIPELPLSRFLIEVRDEVNCRIEMDENDQPGLVKLNYIVV